MSSLHRQPEGESAHHRPSRGVNRVSLIEATSGKERDHRRAAPARVPLKDTLRMAEALARGEPNRGRIALTLFRNKVRDLKGKR